MARIPEDVIERLKAEVAVERLVRAHGIELSKHGAADLVGRCPFHDDKTPSLVLSPHKNLWHCLGACQTGGGPIDWVMKAQRVSFRHAVEILRGEATTAPSSPARKLRPEATAEDAEVLAQVAAYYHETLKESPEALAYLREERGLVHPDLASHFQLGYANRTLGYRLPGRAARARLQRLGVLRDTGHEHLSGSLVIPILGEQGEVLGMYGRKITPAHQLRKGTPLHLYLPGPHRGVFNAAALAASPTVILCEALLDALTVWCAGHRNVTASYGVEGFTDEHLGTFQRHGTKRVLLAYDRDEAGEKAAEALALRLIAAGIECFRVQFPRDLDANEYARKEGPEALSALLRHAVWLGKGKPPVALPDAPETPSEPEKPTKPADPPPLAADSGALPDEVTMAFGDRRYRIRGLGKNTAPGTLKVNVLAAKGEAVHVDTLDLYSSRQRAAFVKQVADELKAEETTVKRDVGQILLRLEQLQDERIKRASEPKAREVTLSETEKAAALELLQDGRILERILEDFHACGVVGEETNKLLGYLAAVSRKLEEPLAVVIQSSSAAGKTSLMEAILAFLPEEERVKYSAMTGQSLFYMGETDLKHKVLAIVEEAGAEKAAYALKLLQSEGELTIASTGKDPASGRLVTHEYRVEGPVMIFLTTTAVEIDEELLNRCLVLTVDEDREQTRAIHRLQRERQTLEGLLARQARPAILKVHQDAQRMLKPLLVANPYARHLTFLDDRTRTRRDHVKYLTLIRTIALLHQYQREVKTVEHRGAVVPYIEVTLEDVAIANRLAHQVLGRSLDELAPQTRRLLLALDELVKRMCEAQKIERTEAHFTRKEVRAFTGWSQTQLRVHLDRLVDLEYVREHHGKQGQGYVYELLYDGRGQDGAPFLCGLLDVDALGQVAPGPGTAPTSRGAAPYFTGPSRGGNGPVAGGWRGPGTANSFEESGPELPATAKAPENAHLGPHVEGAPYRGGNGGAGAPILPGTTAH